MAENQRNNLVVAQSYIENKGLRPLPQDYTEEELQKKFASAQASLQEELREYDEYRQELDAIDAQQKESPEDAEKGFSEDELKREYIMLNRDRQPIQSRYDTVKKYSDYLHEYGNEFARLYQIKDNNEKYGNPEELQFVEVDITDNGDMLTQDQYFKMRADQDERVKQLALHVNDKEAGVEYNIGMMEYNQPNMPPQTKVQISFDDDTLADLEADKLKSIFAFCEQHGLSVLDMEIRNFDGTLAEASIREKIEQTLAEIKAAKEAEIAEANNKEYAAQKTREKELNAELQNISLTTDGKLPEGVSEEDISYDLPDEGLVSTATSEPTDLSADGETAVAENAPETIGKVQRLARGVATAAVPDEDVPDNLDEHAAEETTNANAAQSVSIPTPNAGNAAPKMTKKKAVESFEKLIREGWGKEKKLSYWKTSTGWFGHGWTEFIIYDSEDKDNRRKDGLKTKDGNVKYTYALKLFINVDNDGVLHFAYRVPNHKKIDESSLGDIVGQLKDLGYTAINFPAGMPKNDEKGMWRKAMGEKGIVPLNMGLDKSKVEGMLKAAKEKLTDEELADYKYRLGKQMNKYNHAKGKTVSESEQAFIDGLINSNLYMAFTDAYAKVLKTKMKGMLRAKNDETGVSDKVAVYQTLRKLFDAYRSALDHGGSLLNAEGLTDREKQAIHRFGLDGPVNKLTNPQMSQIYDILYERQQKEAYKYCCELLLNIDFGKNNGPKPAHRIPLKAAFDEARENCEDINLDLATLGIEEIKMLKRTNIPFDREFQRYYRVDKPEYERTHPTSSAATRGAAAAAEEADIEGTESRAQTRSARTASEKSAVPQAEPKVVRNITQNKGNIYN